MNKLIPFLLIISTCVFSVDLMSIWLDWDGQNVTGTVDFMIDRFYVSVGDVNLNVGTVSAGGTGILARVGTVSLMKAYDFETDITGFVINTGSFQFGGYFDSQQGYAFGFQLGASMDITEEPSVFFPMEEEEEAPPQSTLLNTSASLGIRETDEGVEFSRSIYIGIDQGDFGVKLRTTDTFSQMQLAFYDMGLGLSLTFNSIQVEWKLLDWLSVKGGFSFSVGSEISLGFSGGFSGNLKGVRFSCDFKEEDYTVRLSGYGASVSITQKEVKTSYNGEIFGFGFEVGASYNGDFEFDKALISKEFSLPYGSFTITGGLKDKTAFMSFGATIEF
ncbi:hypothetical protein [Thermotoga sp. SG1]|uniref:hypothetical protein n=1 Tax=Thermotoga sp. SG1 TaxID=126739 RepID=UPI00130475C8|nr:hypothetical protein [Thermotoga sp. SG1]